jgi:hypothetical protein
VREQTANPGVLETNNPNRDTMKKQLLILLLLPACASHINDKDTFISDSLVKKWETSSQFLTPESVKYDAERTIFYVSNINGKPSDKDGNGFISKLSTDGKIIELEWVKGLDAPKGMGIYQDHLFVTNLTEVVEIEIASGKILNHFPIPGSSFLNDIDIDTKGVIYISDSGNGKIFRILNGKIEEWLKGPELDGVNGLYCSGDTLYAGAGGNLLEIQGSSGKISVFAAKTGGIDGLESCGNGTFIFSDWSGSVYRISAGKPKELLLNTSASKINAADIEYNSSSHTIYIPTFFDNRVMAYQMK